MDLFLFGDQTADQYVVLRRACSRKDSPLLTAFFERTSAVLRSEVQQLSRQQRDLIPDFLTISDLVESYYEKGLKLPQLESCLVTLSQLAHYFMYVSNNHESRD